MSINQILNESSGPFVPNPQSWKNIECYNLYVDGVATFVNPPVQPAASAFQKGPLFGYTESSNTNTSVGYDTLVANSPNLNNTALGWEALNNLTSGHDNVAIGFRAGGEDSVGNDNVVVGASSGGGAGGAGSANVAIGQGCGWNNGVSNSVAIGAGSGCQANSSVAIGEGATSINNGSVVLGSGATDTAVDQLALTNLTHIAIPNLLQTGLLSDKPLRWNGSGFIVAESVGIGSFQVTPNANQTIAENNTAVKILFQNAPTFTIGNLSSNWVGGSTSTFTATSSGLYLINCVIGGQYGTLDGSVGPVNLQVVANSISYNVSTIYPNAAAEDFYMNCNWIANLANGQTLFMDIINTGTGSGTGSFTLNSGECFLNIMQVV